jgi:hypothetical protein
MSVPFWTGQLLPNDVLQLGYVLRGDASATSNYWFGDNNGRQRFEALLLA